MLQNVRKVRHIHQSPPQSLSRLANQNMIDMVADAEEANGPVVGAKAGPERVGYLTRERGIALVDLRSDGIRVEGPAIESATVYRIQETKVKHSRTKDLARMKILAAPHLYCIFHRARRPPSVHLQGKLREPLIPATPAIKSRSLPACRTRLVVDQSTRAEGSIVRVRRKVDPSHGCDCVR